MKDIKQEWCWAGTNKHKHRTKKVKNVITKILFPFQLLELQSFNPKSSPVFYYVSQENQRSLHLIFLKGEREKKKGQELNKQPFKTFCTT